MSGQSKKSSRSSKRRGIPAVVDPADSRRLANILILHGVTEPKLAYKIAFISQGAMTRAYATEFARKVRQHVEWAATTQQRPQKPN